MSKWWIFQSMRLQFILNFRQLLLSNRSHLALLYNDRGVLENHHISAAYRVTQLPAFNIFINVPRNKFQWVFMAVFMRSSNCLLSSETTFVCLFREMRQLVIEMVLNTDMSLHFTQIKTMSKLLKLPETYEKNLCMSSIPFSLSLKTRISSSSSVSFPCRIEKPKVYSLLLHAADISHPTKSWDLHEKWTNLLVEEFFKQVSLSALFQFALDVPHFPLVLFW